MSNHVKQSIRLRFDFERSHPGTKRRKGSVATAVFSRNPGQPRGKDDNVAIVFGWGRRSLGGILGLLPCSRDRNRRS